MASSRYQTSVLLISTFIILLAPCLGTANETFDLPPPPVVDPAEWETSGVLITYPLWIPMSLVVEMSEEAELVTIVANSTSLELAQSAYQAAGVNFSNCGWLIAQPQTGWTRDYGPWQIFTGDDEQGIADFIYAEGFPVDDMIPVIYGESRNIPIYDLPLTQSGTSNYMSDGMGVAMSTERVYDDNPNLSAEEIDTLMHEFLGIDNYIVMQDWLGGSKHIDCWAKIIDPGRVMVRRVDSPHPVLEANVNYLSTLLSSYGRPYEVLRVDETYGTNYCNVLFLNNKILVPQFDNVLDDAAIQTWQEAMPGYEVLGFSYGGFTAGDAVHCRTHELTDRHMLRIVHIPLHDQENTGSNYVVEANIHPYSNAPLVGPPLIMWKMEGGSFNPVQMNYAGDHIYYGEIPKQPDDTRIHYYIEAEDGSSRHEMHPYVGQLGPHHFFIGPDNEHPVVDFNPPSEIITGDWPLTLTTYALDNRWMSLVVLEYLINGVPQTPQEMILQPPSAVYYQAEIQSPGFIHEEDIVQVRVVATDTSLNQNTTTDPACGYYTIDVLGSFNSCVWNACGQNSGLEVHQMLEQTGISSFYCEEQPSSFNPYRNLFIFLGVYPNNHVLTADQEQDIVQAILDGKNVYLEGADCWVYDPHHEALSEAFGIIGIADGEELDSPLLGMQGTFTAGMSFNYFGENNYMDQIEPCPNFGMIFHHDGIGYGVAHQNGTARTVGLCFSFSGLVGNNPVSSKMGLLLEIASYFNTMTTISVSE